MRTTNVIYATGALKKFIDARAIGASREVLTQLSADALVEQEAERANQPQTRLRVEVGPSRGVVLDFDRARHERASKMIEYDNDFLLNG
jgi:hypothetical protein